MDNLHYARLSDFKRVVNEKGSGMGIEISLALFGVRLTTGIIANKVWLRFVSAPELSRLGGRLC